MKFCPMCGTIHTVSVTVCEFCNYQEKSFDKLSKQEIDELMACFEYEMLDDGVRLKAVKNYRLRGAIAVPHFVIEIAPNAFADCKFITRVDLPKALRSIGESAFAHCGDLFDVFIPASVNYVGKDAFSDCYELGVICVASPSQPDGWDSQWLSGSIAKVEWSSTEE